MMIYIQCEDKNRPFPQSLSRPTGAVVAGSQRFALPSAQALHPPRLPGLRQRSETLGLHALLHAGGLPPMHVRARRASAADPQGTAQRALGGTNALPNGSRFDPRAPPEKGVGEQESSKTLPIRHFQEETQRQKLAALGGTPTLLSVDGNFQTRPQSRPLWLRRMRLFLWERVNATGNGKIMAGKIIKKM